MPRNLRKFAAAAIILMALAGFISGLLGARDVVTLPGEAPAPTAQPAPIVAAPEVTPLPTDAPPPVLEPEPEPDEPKPEEKPKPAAEAPAPAPSAKTPAEADAVGDLIQGADAATTQPPPY